jgi:hypothetical protein
MCVGAKFLPYSLLKKTVLGSNEGHQLFENNELIVEFISRCWDFAEPNTASKLPQKRCRNSKMPKMFSLFCVSIVRGSQDQFYSIIFVTKSEIGPLKWLWIQGPWIPSVCPYVHICVSIRGNMFAPRVPTLWCSHTIAHQNAIFLYCVLRNSQ